MMGTKQSAMRSLARQLYFTIDPDMEEEMAAALTWISVDAQISHKVRAFFSDLEVEFDAFLEKEKRKDEEEGVV